MFYVAAQAVSCGQLLANFVCSESLMF